MYVNNEIESKKKKKKNDEKILNGIRVHMYKTSSHRAPERRKKLVFEMQKRKKNKNT